MQRQALATVCLLMFHSVALAEGATPQPSAPTASTAAARKASAGARTPVIRSSDPVVAAMQGVNELDAQAAAAAADAVVLAERGDTTPRAHRQMLLAASQLYNASDQLKRVAQKEKDLAMRGRNAGEQRERIAQAAESPEEKTKVAKQAKDHLAYAALQNGMAESMLSFADELHLLGKQAEAASSGSEDAALSDASKKIEASRKKAEKLVEEVRRTRAKLEKMPR